MFGSCGWSYAETLRNTRIPYSVSGLLEWVQDQTPTTLFLSCAPSPSCTTGTARSYSPTRNRIPLNQKLKSLHERYFLFEIFILILIFHCCLSILINISYIIHSEILGTDSNLQISFRYWSISINSLFPHSLLPSLNLFTSNGSICSMISLRHLFAT